MTLITYPTRVHFAHDILEEALHSECEAAGLRHPLLIGPTLECAPNGGAGAQNDPDAGEFWERVAAGLPPGAHPLRYGLPEGDDPGQAVAAVCRLTDGHGVDLIVAFGVPDAIVLGRKCRKMLAQRGARPALFVVPGIDGLPDPCARSTNSWTNGLPDVIICDPTVLRDTDPARSLAAAVVSLVRGVESYLAQAYNPTADGMALDAFNRCVVTMPRIYGGHDPSVPREIMAAALTAAFSQQKGIGPTQRLTAALMAQRAGLDAAALARLILPGAIDAMGAASDKTDLLGRMLGGGRGEAPARLRAFLGDMPQSAASLSQMGLTPADIDMAARDADQIAGFPAGAARAVLDAIY